MLLMKFKANLSTPTYTVIIKYRKYPNLVRPLV